MRPTLCTIGFAGKTAEEFFRLLGEGEVRTVIDVRENRVGQLSGYAKFPDIEYFLGRIGGIAYQYEPDLAPTPEIRKRYRQTRDWPEYESSFLALMRERGFPGGILLPEGDGAVAFLCSEPGPERCHRRLIAELLAARWRSQGEAVVILHLQLPKPPRATPRRRRKNDGNHSE
jgi:uncharacterized protein (DUF488 family)